MVQTFILCGECGRVVKAQGWDAEGPGFEPSRRNYLHM